MPKLSQGLPHQHYASETLPPFTVETVCDECGDQADDHRDDCDGKARQIRVRPNYDLSPSEAGRLAREILRHVRRLDQAVTR